MKEVPGASRFMPLDEALKYFHALINACTAP